MEDDLEQQVAQLLAQVCRSARLDGLDHLAGLLDQVRQQREVGLIGVPRAVLAQPVHHRDQPLHLAQPARNRLGLHDAAGYGLGAGATGLASEPDWSVTISFCCGSSTP